MRARAEEPLILEPVTLVDEVESARAPALGQRFLNMRTLISFALGFAILLFMFTRVQVDVSGILERVSQANPFFLIAAVLVYYGTFPVRALRWQRLLHNVGLRGPAGIRLPTLIGLSEIVLLSWFANCIVPAKLGDAYRGYLLKLAAAVSFSITVGTILAERIIDVLLLFLLMALAASLSFGRALPGEVVLLLQAGFVLVTIVVLGLLVLRHARPLALRFLPQRLHIKYRRFEHGTLNSFRALPYVLIFSALVWVGEVARLYLVTLSLGLSDIAPSVIVFVALATALATTLPLTPAGLGFAEGTIVALFLLANRAGLAPGVDEHTAASIALLDRGISYWSLIAVGTIVYTFSRRK